MADIRVTTDTREINEMYLALGKLQKRLAMLKKEFGSFAQAPAKAKEEISEVRGEIVYLNKSLDGSKTAQQAQGFARMAREAAALESRVVSLRQKQAGLKRELADLTLAGQRLSPAYRRVRDELRGVTAQATAATAQIGALRAEARLSQRMRISDSLRNPIARDVGREVVFAGASRAGFGGAASIAGGIGGGALAATAAVAGIAALTAETIRAGDQMRRLERRFESLGINGERALDDTYEAAQRLGVSTESLADTYARLALVSPEIGLSSDEALKLAENLTALAAISGVEGSELSAGLTQISQALASGRLQGDELRSILENFPALAREIADGFGVGVGELRELGREGELTADKIARIVLDLDIGGEVADSIARNQTRIVNAWTRLMAELDRAFKGSDFYKDSLNFLADALDGFAEYVANRNDANERADLEAAARDADRRAKILQDALDKVSEGLGLNRKETRDLNGALAGLDLPTDQTQANLQTAIDQNTEAQDRATTALANLNFKTFFDDIVPDLPNLDTSAKNNTPPMTKEEKENHSNITRTANSLDRIEDMLRSANQNRRIGEILFLGDFDMADFLRDRWQAMENAGGSPANSNGGTALNGPILDNDPRYQAAKAEIESEQFLRAAEAFERILRPAQEFIELDWRERFREAQLPQHFQDLAQAIRIAEAAGVQMSDVVRDKLLDVATQANEATTMMDVMQAAMDRISNAATDLGASLADAALGYGDAGDAARQFARIAVAELTKVLLIQLAIKALNPFASGGSEWAQIALGSLKNLGGLANGGIIESQSVAFTGGGYYGLGEDGPEAVLPLQRMPNGKMGVASSGPAPANENQRISIKLINQSGVPLTAEQGENPDEIIIKAAIEGASRKFQADLRRGGNPTSDAIEQTYNVRRAGR